MLLKDYIKNIFNNVILKRFGDSLDIIRRSIFDFLISLDISEIQTAYSVLRNDLLDIIFAALRDEESVIKKNGLQIISQILTKSNKEDFKKNFDTYI